MMDSVGEIYFFFIAVLILVGVIFYDNINMSKRLNLINKELNEIEFFLRDGVCDR